MDEVQIITRSVPAKPRSKNYPTGSVASSSGGGGGNITVTGGTNVDVVKTTDTKTLTDQNVLSSLRAIAEALNVFLSRVVKDKDEATEPSDEKVYSSLRTDSEIKDAVNKALESLEELYLSKVNDDTAEGLIRFLKGIIVSGTPILSNLGIKVGTFASGVSGGQIDGDGNGELFDLLLRGVLSIGNYVAGKSGARITKEGAGELLSLVLREGLQSSNFSTGTLGTGFCLKKDDNGDSYLEVDRALFRKTATFIELLIQQLRQVGGQIIITPASMHCVKVEELEAAYRCYFENTDGEKTIEQEFVIDDLARCQTFNIKEGVHENVGNTYYWRAVVGTGDNYIDLSKKDCDTGSTVPSVGDDIVQLGNKTDATRQAAIVLSAYGNDAPYFKMYRGINSYQLDGKEFVNFSRSDVMIIADHIKFSSGESVKDYIDNAVGGVASDAEEAKKAAADAAKSAAQAATDAKEATNRLNDWAADNKISPTEKQALKDEIARIDADKTQISNGYNKYGLGLPTAFDNAYTSYRTVLVSLTATEPESIAIPSDFKTKQENYYSERTTALTKISDAAKDYAEELVGNIKVGGRNLLFNSALEEANSSWVKNAGYGEYTTLDGVKCFKVERKGGGLYTRLNSINLPEYGTVISSLDVYVTEICNFRLGVEGQDSIAVQVSEINKWVRISKKQELKGFGAYVIYSQTNSTVYFKHVKCELGNVATDWTQAPEDTSSAIQEALETAQDAQTAANNADEKASQAASRLDEWASDSVISPTEKLSLKQEQKMITAEKDSIVADAAKYGVSSTAYVNAFNAYNAELTYHATATPENITIRSSFATNQVAYYTAYKNINSAIADAAKKFANDIAVDLDSYKKTVTAKFEQTNNSITAAVTTSKEYTNTVVSNIQVGGVNLLKGTKDLSFGSFNGDKIQNGYKDFTVIYKQHTASTQFVDIVRYSSFITPKPNTTYTLSFYCKGSGRFSSYFYPSCVLSGENIDGTKTTATDGFISINLTSDWRRVWIKWKTKSSITEVQNLLPIRVQSVTSEIWACGFKFEEGNIATDWTQAPEDIKSSIDSVNTALTTYKQETTAKLTVLEQKIALTVTSEELQQTRTEILNSAATTAQSKADAAKQAAISTAAQDATNKVNAIQIGGRNLAIGSSNGKGWTGGTFKSDDYSFYKTSNSTGESYIYSQYFTLEKGRDITISFEAKQGNAYYLKRTCDLFILSNRYQTEGIVINGKTYAHTTEWTRYTFTAKVPSTIVSPVRIRFDHNGVDDTSHYATIYVRKVKVEYGNKATDWSPAPEDVTSDIEKAKQEAIADAAGKYVTTTTYTQKINQITADLNGVSLKASQTETKVTEIDGEITSLDKRVTASEVAVQPDNIWLGIKNNVNQSIVDASLVTNAEINTESLDENKYYPITINLKAYSARIVIISLEKQLGYGRVPSWSTHKAGFSALCKWSTNGSGWGSSKVNRTIIESSFSFTKNDVPPIGSIGQMTNSSNEYIYVRGGTKYKIKVEGYSSKTTITLRTSAFTAESQTIDLKTEVTKPVVDLSTKLTEAQVVAGININGFGISVFGKNIDFTGKVTFSSLATDAQSKINTAVSDSSAALSTANTANTNASQAKTDASSAKSTATTAKNTADTAKSTADSAKQTATTANTNASTALSTANSAKTTADSALSAANTANSNVTASKDTIAKELGYSSFADMQAKPTIIDGGYIRTSYLESEAIRATIVTASYLSTLSITTGKLTVTDGAKIAGFTINGSNLINTNKTLQPTIKTEYVYGGIDRKAVLGTGLPPSTGLQPVIYSHAKQTSSQAKNIALMLEASGSSYKEEITHGGYANYAIKALGGSRWIMNSGDFWCMPGFLGGLMIETWRDSSGLHYKKGSSWGDGIRFDDISLSGDKVYTLWHNLLHTDYFYLPIGNHNRESGTFLGCTASFGDRSNNMVSFSFWEGANRVYPRFIQILFFGRPSIEIK